MDDLMEHFQLVWSRMFSPTMSHALNLLYLLRKAGESSVDDAAEVRPILEEVDSLTSEVGLKRRVDSGDVPFALTVYFSFVRVRMSLRSEQARTQLAIRKKLGNEPTALQICRVGLRQIRDGSWAFLKDLEDEVSEEELAEYLKPRLRF